ncbi:NAD-dependent epimerase/dehydratase family protein [Rhodopirellula halodulae]|uniref:NAD-dependent epimerase/dehydratase family protein n=1 Tax=Rhodopirellula halodulae TaxID=2894198 RepID=UPI001E332C4D|nr:NAD-dependent epimerase/dehydratase family protein [Rhodopirellula sp. JC737]MCC9656129.1 NAD-dependent epimerase/dehydratase family protein [Rhodopirellula sp. JC737]
MTQPESILVTGATGMIGAPVVRRAIAEGHHVRAVVRSGSDRSVLDGFDVEWITADLTDPGPDYQNAIRKSDVIVHTAAYVGDWGPVSTYRPINLDAVSELVRFASGSDRLRRLVHLSALGVYQATHHFGTDETTPVDLRGFDGYTHTKALAEGVIAAAHRETGMPTVIARPGFTYGEGDRRILPRLMRRFRNGTIRMIGDGQRKLNNTCIDNLIDGLFLCMQRDEAVGETFNIRDERLVTREEFLGAVADYLELPPPKRVPLWFAKMARPVLETYGRLRGASEPPLLTGATMKFMTLNLDFSIEKAKRLLGYQPKVDFREGIQDALKWADENASC